LSRLRFSAITIPALQLGGDHSHHLLGTDRRYCSASRHRMPLGIGRAGVRETGVARGADSALHFPFPCPILGIHPQFPCQTPCFMSDPQLFIIVKPIPDPTLPPPGPREVPSFGGPVAIRADMLGFVFMSAISPMPSPMGRLRRNRPPVCPRRQPRFRRPRSGKIGDFVTPWAGDGDTPAKLPDGGGGSSR